MLWDRHARWRDAPIAVLGGGMTRRGDWAAGGGPGLIGLPSCAHRTRTGSGGRIRDRRTSAGRRWRRVGVWLSRRRGVGDSGPGWWDLGGPGLSRFPAAAQNVVGV